MKISHWRIAAMVIGGIVLLAVAFAVIGFWPGSTKDIEAVANKFQPGDGWELESERISPPMFICLQADCGEVYKVWRGKPAAFTSCVELAAISRSVTGDFKPDDEVKLRNDGSGIVKSCDMRRVVDGKSITFSYQSYNEREQSMIILSIEEK